MICAKHYRECGEGGVCQDCGKVPTTTTELRVISNQAKRTTQENADRAHRLLAQVKFKFGFEYSLLILNTDKYEVEVDREAQTATIFLKKQV